MGGGLLIANRPCVYRSNSCYLGTLVLSIHTVSPFIDKPFVVWRLDRGHFRCFSATPEKLFKLAFRVFFIPVIPETAIVCF